MAVLGNATLHAIAQELGTTVLEQAELIAKDWAR